MAARISFNSSTVSPHARISFTYSLFSDSMSAASHSFTVCSSASSLFLEASRFFFAFSRSCLAFSNGFMLLLSVKQDISLLHLLPSGYTHPMLLIIGTVNIRNLIWISRMYHLAIPNVNAYMRCSCCCIGALKENNISRLHL